jgi:hypothetical protein
MNSDIEVPRRNNVMAGTMANHLATFYQLSRYILECDGQVTESQLFWNHPKLAEEMYGFLIDFGYLAVQVADNQMLVRVAPLWEMKMRHHHNIKQTPVLYWSKAALDEVHRYAVVRRIPKEEMWKLKASIEKIALAYGPCDYIGLLTVLRYTNPQ